MQRLSSRLKMAEARVATANENTEEQEDFGEIIEMITFKSNAKTETNEVEVAINIDNSYAAKRLFTFHCVGEFSGSWSKGVYIEDYTSCDGTISENPNNSPMIGAGYSLKCLNDKSGKVVQLHIWNLAEHKRYFPIYSLFFKNSDGAIVFWGARSDSMDIALEYKDEIRRTAPDIPIVLLVDNVFKPPVKWIGQGLVMNSTEEMDNFCLEHGFFAWFEMRERGAGEKSVFGQSMSTLVDEIISGNTTSAQSCV